jgi:hypothetical protein
LDALDLCHSCEKEMLREGAEVQNEVAKAFERVFARKKNEQVP